MPRDHRFHRHRTLVGLQSEAAAEEGSSHQVLTISLFALFVAITLGITIWASRQNRTAADFYAGGRSFTGLQNGLAIGGDYMSAASFLGIAGLIALYGYDGFLYSIGFLVAWLVALLLVAELMRNTGKFTMADVLSFRMRQRPVRTAASISTVVVSIFYLLAQMVGAGELVALLLGITSPAAKNLVIVGVGLLMIVYVVFGGMKGTTWVQIVKAVMLITGAAIMTFWVLAKYGFNLSALLGAAADKSGKGESFLQPGLRYGEENADATKTCVEARLHLAGVGAGARHRGPAAHPDPLLHGAGLQGGPEVGELGDRHDRHLLPDDAGPRLRRGRAGRVRRRSPSKVRAAIPLRRNWPRRSAGSGTGLGAVMLAVIAAVAFATILAVVAGLTLAASSSLAHDLYSNVIKKGKVTDKQEVRVGRISAVCIGAVSIALAIPAQSLNVAFLVAIAFAIAASANLPLILFSLFWKRFNTRGATWGIYGGLVSALVLLVFSPNVSGGAVNATTGKAASLISDPSIDFAWFPLNNPGLVSIPLGFLFAVVGTITSREYNKAKWAEMEVRSLTGAHAEKATSH